MKQIKLFLAVTTTLALFSARSTAADRSTIKNDSMNNETTHTAVKTDTATFGTGCFWCTEAVFQELKGVVKVTSGYMGGHVANPSYEEVCTGTTGHAECLQIVYDPSIITFDELLEMAGGLRPGRTLKGAIPGGVSMPVLTAEQLKGLPMDYDTLRDLKTGLGSGAIVVLDDTVCTVRFTRRISQFFYKESCGQCTPCREGTGWMNRVLTRIVDGQGTMDDLHRLKAIAGQIEGHTICAFGEAAAWPVQGFLRQFWHEFEYYIVNGRSIVDDKIGAAA